MEYLDVIITGIGIMLVATIIIGYFVIKHKNVKLKGGEILGAQFEIEEKQVDKFQIISMPIAACKGEILTPYLKVKVLDSNGNGIKGKKVRLEFYNNLGLMSIKNISGDLVKYSDKAGCVEYDNISLKESGRIEIYIISDDIEQPIDSVDIFPPGLPIDYWNETVGSEQYKIKLERILNFTQNKV
ncbi:Uncharacterised protein [Roseburia faecis]|uniref:Uncharacterized protein n=1 Tax=Roseburia faecis TaxID=301302 RepID=A0A173V2L4_9FIRM|nr:Uncharacterised protein [Roseburia faecis]